MNQEFEKLKQELLKDPKFRKAYFNRDPAFEIGDMVLDARIRRGWPQEKLAKKAGMMQPAIARIEGGAIVPSIGTLQKIAAALGMSLVLPSFAPKIKKSRMTLHGLERKLGRNLEKVA